MMRTRPVVAIDGPAGAGKSTVARELASRLGYTLVDTGALYRAVALAVERAGIAWDDAAKITDTARALVDTRALVLEPHASQGVSVFLRGQDVSDAIRTLEMGMGASRVSALPGVRDALFMIQRMAGDDGGVVLEGRDIGTVVFPDAEVKFFLSAPAEVRAQRRYEELLARGLPADFASTLAEVRARDTKDTMRPVAPLRQADDAIAIDSSHRAVDDIVEEMAAHVRSVAAR